MLPTSITPSTDSAFIPLPSEPRSSIQTASCFGNNDPCSLAEHRVVILLMVNKLMPTFRIFALGLRPVNASYGSSDSSRSQGRCDSNCCRHSVRFETTSDPPEGIMVGLLDLHTADRAVAGIQFHVHQLISGDAPRSGRPSWVCRGYS